jgi:hypothetical protein
MRDNGPANKERIPWCSLSCYGEGKRPDGCLGRLCRPDGFWGEIFLEKLRPLLDDKSKLTEVPRVQRYVSRPSLDDLLPRDALPGKRERDELIRRAHRECGYSYSERGRHVGFHYATVSRLVNGVIA